MPTLNAAKVSAAMLEKGQNRVIDASLTLIRERAKLKACHIYFYPSFQNLCLFSVVFFLYHNFIFSFSDFELCMKVM